MLITHKLWVDADLGVVSCTLEEFLITAGQAAIVRLTAGLSAVVRIPVFGAILFSDECFDIFTVCCVVIVFVNVFGARADGIIVYLHIFFFSAPLIDGEDPVREVLAVGRI